MSSSSVDELTGKVLVSVEDGIKVHSSRDVKFIDGSWFLKDRNARQEYQDGPRILDAHYFDIDDVASKGSDANPKGLPHMMPPKQLFAAAMDAMGITNSHHLVVYASPGCLFPHRAWYQLIALGHAPELVHYMQGSLDDWINAGGPTEDGPKEALNADNLSLEKEKTYQATDAKNIMGLQDILDILNGKSEDSVLVDVRARERFLGQVEEPRPNMRLGHMPNAVNVPFTDLLEPENVVKFKPREELLKVFAEAGLDVATEKRIVSSCGSGATACALVLALTVCGRDLSDTYIYDGSWSEYGAEADTPIVQ